MAETPKFALPLLAPSQAQKHVTVNEALARLDALAQLRLASVTLATPPGSPAEGTAYAVPAGAAGHWIGQDGRIAIATNGGWSFADPEEGWQGWITDQGIGARFDGAQWVADAPAVQGGVSVLEFDHMIAAGTSSATQVEIPQYAVVFAVIGRVKSAITGTLTSWTLGVVGSEDRYGAGLGLPLQSWVVGVTGQPVTYYSGTPLLLSATGGDFAGGEVRLAIHHILPEPPEV